MRALSPRDGTHPGQWAIDERERLPQAAAQAHCPGFPPSTTDQFGPLDGSSNRTPPEPVAGWGINRPWEADEAADPGDLLRPTAVGIRPQRLADYSHKRRKELTMTNLYNATNR